MRNAGVEQTTDRYASEGGAPEVRKVTITMPDWMFEDMKGRARRRGITVTELMRRAVSLERMLFEDPDAEVILRYSSGKEVALRLV
jgi:hypothetical protein